MYIPENLSDKTFLTSWTEKEAGLYFKRVSSEMERYYKLKAGRLKNFYNSPNKRVSLLVEELQTEIENLPVPEWLKLVGNFGAGGKNNLGLLRLENMMRRRLLERYFSKVS